MDDGAIESFIERGKTRLGDLWKLSESRPTTPESIPRDVLTAIERTVNSPTKTYRYVALTQLLAKAVDPAKDARAVQERASLAGAFDARSFCHKVIVPFDRSHHSVLGGSPDPYVNNPLRVLSVTPDYHSAQKNVQGFDDLIMITQYAQDHPKQAVDLTLAVLHMIRERLNRVDFVYPVPNRISLAEAVKLLTEYLQERSGGTRMQAISVALFRCIGHRFGLFRSVISRHVNAADASAGNVADLECVDDARKVVLAAEIKDRKLTLVEAETKLPTLRKKGIQEFLFVIRGGVAGADADEIDALVVREYRSGQNIYVCEFDSLIETCLVLFGEEGRRLFLELTGEELDRSADLQHREAWRDLLASV